MTTRIFLSYPAAAILCLLVSAQALGQEANWPTFRGAQRTGVSPETGLLADWPAEGPKLVWEAEGCGRGNDGDLRRFCEISMGSAAEVEYQLLLSFDLKTLNQPSFDRLNNELVEIKRMLHSFVTTLRKSS